MDQQVLVAYASKYGSTQEVAEAVAEVLRGRGLEVDLQHMPEVRSLARYDAFVLGAPLYMFRWHKDARRFLSRHRKALTKRPVAIFALGPITPGDAEEWQASCEQLDKELARRPWLTPVVVEMFGGRIDHSKMSFPYSLIMSEVPASDLRDWTAIRAWAGKLPVVLQLEAPKADGTDAG
ncbi:MAG: flavodoxin domain-containing protein [Fidelibacterota bacterium]|nr:MAG: flavodoxin domain-containing protein [Candidatus Neomarinimicrobiota bacterium]